MLTLSNDLKKLYPNAKFGVLIMKDVIIQPNYSAFNNIKKAVINQLINSHQNYERKEFTQSEPACFYKNYYKKFKKTYPVLLELESVIVKLKPLPSAPPLVEAMFLGELKNFLLTAGHDLDKINFPVKLALANGTESFTGISEREQLLTKDDMLLSDGTGIISSILNGPDYRTRITKETKNVLFFIYTPEGISDDIIRNHLYDIQSYVLAFAPHSKTSLLDIFK